MKKGKFLTLAIESSCDETAAAVLADGREVLSSVISSQIAIHEAYGGVVPEIASRHHLTAVGRVVAEAMEKAQVSKEDIDLIGVTCGPGLVGALVIGIAAAKALAFAWEKPLVGVNHMYGHVCANLIQYPELAPPFLCLVVSGGHTNLIRMETPTCCTVLGSTRDDAAGEAYDKVARVIGLGYPGGPKIDRLARQGDPAQAPYKRVMLEEGSLDFSFSGLKTAVLNDVNSKRQAGKAIREADIAAGFQEAVVDVLCTKAILAAQQTGEDRLVLAGGVAANGRLREALQERCQAAGLQLFLPDPVLCTDNAAMIGCAAYYQYLDRGPDDLSLDAWPHLEF